MTRNCRLCRHTFLSLIAETFFSEDWIMSFETHNTLIKGKSVWKGTQIVSVLRVEFHLISHCHREYWRKSTSVSNLLFLLNKRTLERCTSDRWMAVPASENVRSFIFAHLKPHKKKMKNDSQPSVYWNANFNYRIFKGEKEGSWWLWCYVTPSMVLCSCCLFILYIPKIIWHLQSGKGTQLVVIFSDDDTKFSWNSSVCCQTGDIVMAGCFFLFF